MNRHFLERAIFLDSWLPGSQGAFPWLPESNFPLAPPLLGAPGTPGARGRLPGAPEGFLHPAEIPGGSYKLPEAPGASQRLPEATVMLVHDDDGGP